MHCQGWEACTLWFYLAPLPVLPGVILLSPVQPEYNAASSHPACHPGFTTTSISLSVLISEAQGRQNNLYSMHSFLCLCFLRAPCWFAGSKCLEQISNSMFQL